MRLSSTCICAVAASLSFAATASADRHGQAPVYNPRVVDTHHVSFTLLGSGWGQARGQTGATPELGRYGQTGDSGCRMTANVSATVTSYRPTVSGRYVDVPGNFRRIRVAQSGRNSHGVRWWLGAQAGVRAAALGYQRAPANLARSGHPWLVYKVILRGISKNPSCTAAQGRSTARAISKSLHLTHGAVEPRAPFYP